MERILLGLASFIIPGLGQLLKSKFLPALCWFVGAGFAYWTGYHYLGNSGWIPGIIVNVLSAINASK